jgi:hypothetical protein
MRAAQVLDQLPVPFPWPSQRRNAPFLLAVGTGHGEEPCLAVAFFSPSPQIRCSWHLLQLITESCHFP